MFDNLLYVASAPRAGSTWLGNLLNSNPDIIYRHEPLGRIYQYLPQGVFERLKLNQGLSSEERIQSLQIISQAYIQCDRPPFFKKNYFSYPVHARYLFWLSASKYNFLHNLYRKINSPSVNSKSILLIKETGWSSNLESILAGLAPKRVILLMRHPCAIISSMLDGIELKLMKGPVLEYRNQWYESHQRMPYLLDKNISIQYVLSVESHTFLAMRLRVLYDIFLEIIQKFGEKIVVVVYEDLQKEPIDGAKKLFQSLHLDFHHQTENFILESTGSSKKNLFNSLFKDSKDPFYSVQRQAGFKPDKWRSKLSAEKIMNINQIIGDEILERFWPSL